MTSNSQTDDRRRRRNTVFNICSTCFLTMTPTENGRCILRVNFIILRVKTSLFSTITHSVYFFD